MVDKSGTAIRERISTLVESFPALSGAPGVRPWDATDLDEWAAGGEPGHGAICAAQFVLSVWNPKLTWSCGKFDLHEALGTWDEKNTEAFQSWINEPWWP